MLNTIEHKIIRALASYIETATLYPGDKLPGERELASICGVSRPSLRKALDVLADNNIITIRHGSGTYLNQDAPFLLREYISRHFGITIPQKSYYDFMETRELIEINAIRLTALRATPEFIRELEQITTRMSLSSGDYSKYHLEDSNFHLTLIKGTQNKILIETYSTIREALFTYMIEVGKVIPDENYIPGISLAEHLQILECIKKRDPDRAQKLMKKHMQTAWDIANRYLREMGLDSDETFNGH